MGRPMTIIQFALLNPAVGAFASGYCQPTNMPPQPLLSRASLDAVARRLSRQRFMHGYNDG